MDTQELIVRQERQYDPTNPEIPLGYSRTIAGNLRKNTSRTKAMRKDLNNFCPLPGGAKGYPFNDEIVVRVDRFSDEATCKACNGTGHSDSTCPECGGNKGSWFDAAGNKDNRSTIDRSALTFVSCTACRASQYGDPTPRSTGRIPCKPCKGQGQALEGGSIAISTAYEDQPTTGIVMAIGPRVKRVERGMRVLFSRFAGQEYETEGRKYRIMKDMYPMMQIMGQADIRIREAATLG
jgi:co-chaperonin GroES (HSP10)/DNA-directed RNA polymerase subunit M/transcription elongation factor TFIIS